jgi:4-amino-4-deoxy-L-arabinose transferase-like glycosyltransferase
VKFRRQCRAGGLGARPALRQGAPLEWLLLAGLILVPRYYLWGTVPAGIHGDEGGFAAVGMAMFSAPAPLWSFGPQSLPNAHFWLYGAAIYLLGFSVWSARFATSVFGTLQAFAVVDIARRTAGMCAALTAALVMAIPLQLHFDRLAMCNVMTTATWVLALWCLVRFPQRTGAALAAGMLLALGWYGYQSSRIVPLIAAGGLLPLLARSSTRRSTLRLTGYGCIGFALVIAPLAYGFLRDPPMLLGRASSTSWLEPGEHLWPMLASHLQATIGACLGLQFDSSGGFFPFAIPLIPIGVMGLAILGLVASRSSALRWCLATWIVLVLIGNLVRAQYPVYSPVLVCMVPALALAAALSALWLHWVAPLGVLIVAAQPAYEYYQSARHIPDSELIPMAQAALLQNVRDAPTVLIAGGVGCTHGLTAFALRGRPCFGPPASPFAPLSPAELVILFPPYFALDHVLSTRAELVEYQRQWNTTPVHIWSSRPVPRDSPL